MNTLTKMFSFCFCISALVFSSPDTKLNDYNIKTKLEPISIVGETDGPKSLKPNSHAPSVETRDCTDCEFDWTAYGSECCDSAWDEFSISCADLEANYGWDCAGCLCVGDVSCEEQGLITCENGAIDGGNCAVDESGCLGAGECPADQVLDCDGSGECHPVSWIGDGFADCEDQAYGADLTCYDNDGGDCAAGGTDGGTDGGATDGGTTGGGSESCESCEFDWTAYGSECCDSAWDDFGINCADLEANYGWDCAGCACPGDGPAECGDGNCTGDETFETCPEDCNAPGECDPGFVVDCADLDCCPESWIGDGFQDCEDQAYGCDLTCYDNDGGDCGGTTTDGGTDGGTTGGGECPDGTVEDCDGSGECCAESWIGDGFEDCEDQAYGCDLTCYDNDGGDCGPACPDGEVECWDGSCAASDTDCPEQPEIETPGICAEGTVLYDAPAVTITWFIETVCGDGVCNGDEDYYNCPDDCNAPGECDAGFVPDCVDDDCCPESWIGDGFQDCEDQAYGCDLTCYDNDGGDCGAGGTDGGATDGGATDGGTTGGGSESCESCEFDWTAYGSECCDTAWDEFGISCVDLEANYGWDCAGCACPGDGPAECGDGNCTGDEDYYGCPEDCNAPGECDPGFILDCADLDCCPESWIGDGFADCEDQAYGCDLTCYDNDGGDCSGRDVVAGPREIGTVNTSDYVKAKKGTPYSRSEVASATFHGAYDAPVNREVLLNLNFEVLSGYNAGFTNTWQTDPSLGEFTVYGFGADDFVCVTAQACDGGACGELTEPVCVLAGALDGVQECVEGGDACGEVVGGDVTLDGEVNVLDIVQIVNHILESALLTDECAIQAADFTADGEVNVLDIVQIVNLILQGRPTGDASSAILKNVDGRVSIEADGYIGGVQMTLLHDANFSIDITDNAMVADYNTMGTTTKLVVVAPESGDLFSYSGDFTIDEMIVANSTDEVNVVMPSSIEFLGAYPNPFNPSTTLSITANNATNASVMAYDITGRLVDVVFKGAINSGVSTMTWDASSLPSGVYFVKVSTPDGLASMQKVMLMK